MKVSTKGRYGLRIMLELALQYEKTLVTVREIALNQGISEKYIEQIISLLNKAGLVRSQRGASGGYRLADSPQKITVGQILRVTEGGLNIVDCIGSGNDACEAQEYCLTRDVWSRLKAAIETVSDGITLADLVTRYNEHFNFSYII